MIIAVSGKGGTGKTLVSSLLIKSLTSTRKDILLLMPTPTATYPKHWVWMSIKPWEMSGKN